MYDDWMNKLTQISLAWDLFRNNQSHLSIAETLGVHRETVGIWIARIQGNTQGLPGFLKEYTNAKKGERKKRKIDGLLKKRIYSIRKKYRDCCGEKIRAYLLKEYGESPSSVTIYKVLREKYQLRSKYVKNVKRGKVPKAEKPRQVVQMNTVDFGGIFAFTSIDIFSKDIAVKLYPDLRSKWGVDFLHGAFRSRFHQVDIVQTDGGSEFKDEFIEAVHQYAGRHRVARPYKKNEQAFIESFNKTLRKECLGWVKYPLRELPYLQKEVQEFTTYYHTERVHLSLNMKTPNEILKDYQLLSDI